MAAPWSLFALVAILAPLTRRRQDWPASVAFPWFWAVANLAMFCTWSTAKPNYYLPCVPSVAILTGLGWVRIARLARETRSARRLLLGHWVILFVLAALLPLVVAQKWPAFLPASAVITAAVLSGVILSVWAWKQGADALALAPLSASVVALALVIYQNVTPRLNSENGYRTIAARIDQALPQRHTVHFFRELDEGLWYYLSDRTLEPIPDGQIRYNTSFDLLDAEAGRPHLRRLGPHPRSRRTPRPLDDRTPLPPRIPRHPRQGLPPVRTPDRHPRDPRRPPPRSRTRRPPPTPPRPQSRLPRSPACLRTSLAPAAPDSPPECHQHSGGACARAFP